MDRIHKWSLRRHAREREADKENQVASKRPKSVHEPAVVSRHPSVVSGEEQPQRKRFGLSVSSNTDVDEKKNEVVIRRPSIREEESLRGAVGLNRLSKRKSGTYLEIPIPKPLSASSRSLSLRNFHSCLTQHVPTGIRNVDFVEVEKDPLHCSDVANDIVTYMRGLEKRRAIATPWHSPNIKLHMRAILVDWLTQVEHHQRLHLGTFYFAVNMIDRYVQTGESIETESYQLLGITALFLASKIEERYAIKVEELTYLTDSTYCYDDVVNMEKKLVTVLKFELLTAEAYFFLCRFLQCAGFSNYKNGTAKQIHDLCSYLLDLIVTDEIWLERFPSHLAAAALCLTLRMVLPDKPDWDATMEFYSGYNKTALESTMNFMAYCLQLSGAGRLVGAFNKYLSRSKDRIAADEALTCENPVVVSAAKKNKRVKTME